MFLCELPFGDGGTNVSHNTICYYDNCEGREEGFERHIGVDVDEKGVAVAMLTMIPRMLFEGHSHRFIVDADLLTILQ